MKQLIQLIVFSCILAHTAHAQTWSGTTPGAIYYNVGGVGIGTPNPQQKFVVSNGGAEGLEVYLNQPSGVVGLQSYNRSSTQYSQMRFDASKFSFMSGNVGIGSTSFNGAVPRFGVKTDAADYVAQLEGNTTLGSSYGVRILAGTNNSDASFVVGNAANTTTYLVIKGDGNVGVGTATPETRLHVEGTQLVSGTLHVGSKHMAMGYNNRLDFGVSGNWDPIWLSRYNHAEDVSELRLNIGDDGGDRFTIGHHYYSDGAWRPAVSITSAGQMFIGTTENASGYKLAVGGNIIAEKIKVKLQPWADYVFEPSYKLPSLQEVEMFIQQHKHLPDVPSAKEVEANGLDLGGNQAVLLQKIEEQMLYILELNKRIEKLEVINQQLLLERTTTKAK